MSKICDEGNVGLSFSIHFVDFQAKFWFLGMRQKINHFILFTSGRHQLYYYFTYIVECINRNDMHISRQYMHCTYDKEIGFFYPNFVRRILKCMGIFQVSVFTLLFVCAGRASWIDIFAVLGPPPLPSPASSHQRSVHPTLLPYLVSVSLNIYV